MEKSEDTVGKYITQMEAIHRNVIQSILMTSALIKEKKNDTILAGLWNITAYMHTMKCQMHDLGALKLNCSKKVELTLKKFKSCQDINDPKNCLNSYFQVYKEVLSNEPVSIPIPTEEEVRKIFEMKANKTQEKEGAEKTETMEEKTPEEGHDSFIMEIMLAFNIGDEPRLIESLKNGIAHFSKKDRGLSDAEKQYLTNRYAIALNKMKNSMKDDEKMKAITLINLIKP